jgi:phosphohistidine phosphatase SixA
MRLARRQALALAALFPAALRAHEGLWATLRTGGVVLLLRHAQTTAGVGDPPGFRLDDCATQRNLDERGRQQSRAWGEALRREGVTVSRVLSSAWCRCLETAELMSAGPVEVFAPLSSFFEDRAGAAASRTGIRAFVRSWRGPGVAVLVTHQVNIMGAYGVGTRMGEGVVVVPDEAGGRTLGSLGPLSL